MAVWEHARSRYPAAQLPDLVGWAVGFMDRLPLEERWEAAGAAAATACGGGLIKEHGMRLFARLARLQEQSHRRTDPLAFRLSQQIAMFIREEVAGGRREELTGASRQLCGARLESQVSGGLNANNQQLDRDLSVPSEKVATGRLEPSQYNGHTMALPARLQLQLQRPKRTGGGGGRAGGGGGGGGRNEEQKPRRRRPRFKPSPKIMNTATLRELGDLAAAEVAGWNAKELAAAARRAVSLWRHEQPRAAARVRLMQRLPLLPPLPPRVEGAAAAGAASGAAAVKGGGSLGQKPHVAQAGGAASGTRAVTAVEEEDRPRGHDALRTARSSVVADPAADPAAAAPVPATAARADDRPEARAEGSAPARRKVTGGAFRTALVDKPLRPPELLLAQLVERIVRAANGRLTEGFGSRELSSVVWSLVALGYWQPPLLPLVSAFADYGAERLRGADPIAMAMMMQVLAKARAASLAGQPTAARLLELAPAAATAAAASLPRCLPSCEPRTLAGLLHSCAVLLSPDPAATGQDQHHLAAAVGAGGGGGGGGEPSVAAATAVAAPAASTRGSDGTAAALRDGPSGDPQGPLLGPLLGGRCSQALASLARDVTRECVRRRFIGFGPAGILTAAGALAALRRVPAVNDSDGTADGGGGGGGDTAWSLLAAAAVSPLAPQMAGATAHQWALLLRFRPGCWQVLPSAATTADPRAGPALLLVVLLLALEDVPHLTSPRWTGS
ncbi:hypothetical protein PLESTB_000279900 [Pleodorina starrii]|uniref:Uncharacterized protein n=1 Tax=Pleodorina starrii TaxID=330485 RepID=A0A9W6EYN7_9CHLO|nr:hypothetical protein PLESTB_000279900 [Pleodorina starrii]